MTDTTEPTVLSDEEAERMRIALAEHAARKASEAQAERLAQFAPIEGKVGGENWDQLIAGVRQVMVNVADDNFALTCRNFLTCATAIESEYRQRTQVAQVTMPATVAAAIAG